MDEAKVAWHNMLQWRKDWQVDTIMERQLLSAEQSTRYRRLFPHGLHGMDREVRSTHNAHACSTHAHECVVTEPASNLAVATPAGAACHDLQAGSDELRSCHC